jgi:hypothetical protein
MAVYPPSAASRSLLGCSLSSSLPSSSPSLFKSSRLVGMFWRTLYLNLHAEVYIHSSILFSAFRPSSHSSLSLPFLTPILSSISTSHFLYSPTSPALFSQRSILSLLLVSSFLLSFGYSQLGVTISFQQTSSPHFSLFLLLHIVREYIRPSTTRPVFTSPILLLFPFPFPLLLSSPFLFFPFLLSLSIDYSKLVGGGTFVSTITGLVVSSTNSADPNVLKKDPYFSKRATSFVLPKGKKVIDETNFCCLCQVQVYVK